MSAPCVRKDVCTSPRRRWSARCRSCCRLGYLQHKDFPWPATVRRVEADLDGFEVPADVLELVQLVPESVAREHALLPIGFQDGTLVLAMRDPDDPVTLEILDFILNRNMKPVPAAAGQIIEAISRHYGDPDAAEVGQSFAGCFMSPSPFPSAGTALDFSEEDNRRAGRLLTRLIEKAVRRKARTVRIEAEPDCLRVLYLDAPGAVQGQVCSLRLFKPVVLTL
jgi:type IV pilus assembly protein PilB